jgi:hypothetical protein
MKNQILDNGLIEFFNTLGTSTAKIEISGSDLIIKPTSASNDGNIILGNSNSTTSDVEFGTPAVPVTLKLVGGGTLTANGNTLNIGSTSPTDTVNLYNVTFTQSLFLTGSASITGSVTADNFIGSVLDINSSSSFTGLPTSEPTITGSLWISGSSTAHPNSGYLMVFNP